MRRKIEVVAFDPQWKSLFKKEQALLVNIIGDNAVKIEHIGSTSVPGLCAKPIIDILIEVSSINELDVITHHMAKIGYLAKGENGISGRRYFQKGENNRSHHIHAFETADEHLFRHQAFKAYLIENTKIANEYGQIKLAAAEHANDDINHYMALKNDFIQRHENIALSWFKKRDTENLEVC